jgi:MICOS complex subunit MIC60
VERERDGRLSKLTELSANVNQLEKLATGWSDVIDTNLKTQQLQVAIDAVRTVLEQADRPRPFVRELVAVKELAADDPVVAAAIASINPSAYQRGIPPTSEIIDRFRRVASEVRKASLLPEDAGIASHAGSFIMSKIMFKKDALGGGDDVESILTRTENLLEEGNLDAAAREINSLQGWPKILSKDWLADVRRVLEVKQALEVSFYE